ncbi:MAG: hypothetical protein Fur0043_12310 [Anaerolineales bacterium]
MNKKLTWLVGALVLTLLAVGIHGVTNVYADDTPPPPPSGERGPRGGHGLDGAALEAVAGALNMSTDDLSAALAEGKTLQELAEAAGVDMQAVKDAMSAARAESMRERIAQSLTDGTITQDHADWLLEGLEKGYLDGPRFGLGGPGFGFGGPPPKDAPPTTSE